MFRSQSPRVGGRDRSLDKLPDILESLWHIPRHSSGAWLQVGMYSPGMLYDSQTCRIRIYEAGRSRNLYGGPLGVLRQCAMENPCPEGIGPGSWPWGRNRSEGASGPQGSPGVSALWAQTSGASREAVLLRQTSAVTVAQTWSQLTHPREFCLNACHTQESAGRPFESLHSAPEKSTQSQVGSECAVPEQAWATPSLALGSVGQGWETSQCRQVAPVQSHKGTTPPVLPQVSPWPPAPKQGSLFRIP